MFYRKIDFQADEDFGQKLHSLLKKTRIVHIVNMHSVERPREMYEKLAKKVGAFIPIEEDSKTGERTGEFWSDIRYDPELETYFRHSKTAQPLHTDSAYQEGTPDITFFYCDVAALSGGATTFIDSYDLIYHLKNEDPELFDDLLSTSIRFGKGSDVRIRKSIAFDQFGPILNWNYYRVMATEGKERVIADRFFNYLDSNIVKKDRCLPVCLKPGDVIFFHDERVLHGRNSFEANRKNDRLLWKGGVNLF